MRAPLSKLAKEILDNPESAQQLKAWVDSGAKRGTITLTTANGQLKRITATKRNSTTATNGFEPVKRTWRQRVKDFFHDMLGAIINPFG